MRLRSLQYRLRQSFYRPGKSRFFSADIDKDLEEIDKTIEKGLSGLLGGRKDKKDHGKEGGGG